MREKIAQALKDAVEKQDKRRVATLRLIQTAIKDRDIANRGAGKDPVSDDDIMEILTRMVRQRQESAKGFEEGNRLELAEQEREEIGIISEFLPRPLNEDDMRQVCAEVVHEVGADGLRDMRRCMNALKEKFPGRMDLGKASGIVKQMLR
ncbi:GatB/YqeY domain-containing protein [Chelativorans intermedius]|uniref:GatB/YqeY domain-containing protein n=1 Tax=Chelativorans intermedius TaxID=515947 RepID=A0ABV6D903_9HYPH|nr:GatB/YqeY domain-containing protein [Chelativorans intermedius]MCT8998738.1 GatB/YqeY domain-containing protein [Chelativorans intermedius]